MKRLETMEDLAREIKAIERFVSKFGGSYKKLDPNDIDFRVFDKDNNLIAYVEVKGRKKTISNAYPLPVSLRKVAKLSAKMLNPVIIWACEDGIIYGQINKIQGTVRWGGREPRQDAYNDAELMIYYDKQKELRYYRYYE